MDYAEKYDACSDRDPVRQTTQKLKWSGHVCKKQRKNLRRKLYQWMTSMEK